MTDLRALVEQMRALCEKASSSPWKAVNVTLGDGSRRTAIQVSPLHTVAYTFRFSDDVPPDAEFIAACRDGVPQLLDALAGAEKEKTAAEAGRILTQESMQRWIDFHNDRADKAEARLSKLQELGRRVVEAVQGMARPLSPAANRALAELDLQAVLPHLEKHFAEVMAQRLEAEANTYINQRDVDTVLECAAFLRESDR